MTDTRWYLQRSGKAVQIVIEERAEPRRGVVAVLDPHDLCCAGRRLLRRCMLITQLADHLAERIARGLAEPAITYDPEDGE